MNSIMKHILIVDDEQAITKQIKIVLSPEMDFKVDIAYNGKEALDEMQENGPYDLLILAILIPKLDGMEVCQAMLKDEKLKKIPVLLISILPLDSKAFHRSLESFPELRIVKACLQKPFLDKDLLSKVKAIVGYGSYD